MSSFMGYGYLSVLDGMSYGMTQGICYPAQRYVLLSPPRRLRVGHHSPLRTPIPGRQCTSLPTPGYSTEGVTLLGECV